MVEANGDRQSSAVPRQLPMLGVDRIAVAPLSDDTLAQIVRLLHTRRIQVNQDIPRGLHAAVARHVLEAHEFECITRDCPQARAWAADLAASRPIAPGRASLLA